MPRVKAGPAGRKRRKKILRAAKGFVAGRRRLYKNAKETVHRSWVYAYRDRRQRKRHFRRLWIARINAAARQSGMSYSQMMGGLNKAGVELDRKVLADLAVFDASGFATLVETAKKALD